MKDFEVANRAISVPISPPSRDHTRNLYFPGTQFRRQQNGNSRAFTYLFVRVATRTITPGPVKIRRPRPFVVQLEMRASEDSSFVRSSRRTISRSLKIMPFSIPLPEYAMRRLTFGVIFRRLSLTFELSRRAHSDLIERYEPDSKIHKRTM